MNTHPLPISRIPEGLPTEVTSLSEAVIQVVATAELATSEVLRLGEVVTLRLVNHQRRELAEVPNVDAMQAKVEAAEAASRDRMAELRASEQARKNTQERVVSLETALARANTLIDDLKAELVVLRGPHPTV